MPVAVGSFDIDLRPAAGPEPAGVSRFTFDKQFSGDLEGHSRGTMLSAGDPTTGTAGYVVMETFDGTLAGLAGTFVMQHSGTMAAGTPTVSIVVTPGSATGALAGLAGTLTIDVDAGGGHRYSLDHTLPG